MKKLKIGSFNLYNLVSPNKVYYNNKKYSNEDYTKKVKWIQSQISNMNADIIGFQEIFHKKAFKEALSSRFNSEQIKVLNPSGESPVVGIASVYPFLKNSVKSIKEIPRQVIDGLGQLPNDFDTFSRPVLKAQLQITDEIVITVFVCHLKSKRPLLLDNEDGSNFMTKAIGETRSLLKRSVEATGLRALILDEIENSDVPVIVIGDLNDSTRSVTSNIIAGPEPWKFINTDIKKQYWDKKLYSSFDIISQKSFKKEWPTHIHNGHYESLDHIYVSQELYFRNPNCIGNVSNVHIYNDHLEDGQLSSDKLPKWKSDHGQVVATIKLRKKGN